MNTPPPPPLRAVLPHAGNLLLLAVLFALAVAGAWRTVAYADHERHDIGLSFAAPGPALISGRGYLLDASGDTVLRTAYVSQDARHDRGGVRRRLHAPAAVAVAFQVDSLAVAFAGHFSLPQGRFAALVTQHELRLDTTADARLYGPVVYTIQTQLAPDGSAEVIVHAPFGLEASLGTYVASPTPYPTLPAR